MVDPAALGTLRIGLDAIDAERQSGLRARRSTRAEARRQAPTGLRLAVAAALRRAADLLEPRSVSEGAAG